MGILGIAGLITAGASAGAVLWRALLWCRNITEAMRCLLRADMMSTYYKHCDEKALRQYEAEAFKKSYAGYRALGGNSFINDVHDEVAKWKILS